MQGRSGRSAAWLVVGAAAMLRSSTAAAEPVAPSHAGALALAVRYPWYVQSLPGSVVVGLGGLALAADARVTDRIYLGAIVESESVTRVTGATVPAEYGSLRGGAEARGYLDDGTDWIGVRYGAESVDGGVTIGRFADATLGTDIALGGVGVGVTLTVGASREPSGAFAGPARPARGVLARRVASGASPSATVSGPYVGFAISLVL